MPTRSRRPSGDDVPRDEPDERLRAELQRIDETNFEEPEQKVHERSFAIYERLSLELPRLTDLAQVPSDAKARVPVDPERPGRFRGAVLDVVLDAWENADGHMEALQLPSTHPALYRAVAALRSAKHALADLDERHREALCWPIAEVESGIDRFLMWVLGEEAERIKRRAHRRGRRAGTVKDRMFQIFVRDLLLATEACGGRLGFEKNIGTGPLVEAINILKPCLPKGPGYLVKTPMRRGPVGWFIACGHCGAEFESKGWKYCPTCMVLPAEERRSAPAVTDRQCQAPGCVRLISRRRRPDANCDDKCAKAADNARSYQGSRHLRFRGDRAAENARRYPPLADTSDSGGIGAIFFNKIKGRKTS